MKKQGTSKNDEKTTFLYCLFQHLIYIKSEFRISVHDARMHTVTFCFQIFQNNFVTYSKSRNVTFTCLLEINVFFITASSTAIKYCHICLMEAVTHRTNRY